MQPGTTGAELPAALQQQLGARLVETHISWVLLDGRQAWKIKKPVRLPFLDASELATRRRLCEEELRLNRRLAPALYLDVVAITGSPQAPRLGGEGAPIEYALRMRQFAAGALLDERLAAGTLQGGELDQLAQRLAAFHRQAAVVDPASPYGSPESIEAATRQVMTGLAPSCADACAALRPWCAAQEGALRETWLRRRATGHVIEGHGDLHLANVVNLDGEVTAFDCIEFDPALRWIDAQNDIAFLVMDLLAHRRGDLAARFLCAYLDASGDHAGLPTLRYYLVYRALVRALVQRLRGAGVAEARPAPDYLALALDLTRPSDARLLITHGLSGSGKSRVSGALLERTQAIRLRSDVERKRLAGLAADADSGLVPGAGIYGADFSQRTYAHLREQASVALRSGWRVIVDATFLRRTDRDDFRQLARELGVPFTILHCEAPPALLRERVQRRHERGDDASEADVAVLEQQLSHDQPLQADEQADEQSDEQACVIIHDSAVPWTIDAIAARWLAAQAGGRSKEGAQNP